MASTAALAKLPVALRDLVTNATVDGSSDFGKSEKDKAEVTEWIDKIAVGEIVRPQNLKDLDGQLTPRTYLVSNYYTVADTALYGALHPVFSQFQAPTYYSYPALTRYFDHIQNQPQVRKAASSVAPAFSLVPFDLENAPKLERKADPPKQKKEKAAKEVTPTDALSGPAVKGKKGKETSTGTAPADATAGEAKVSKKEKKPVESADGGKKKEKAVGGGKAAVEEASGVPVPSMIDLRVGHIVDIKKHPDADGLYVEQIDFGEPEGPRTVVSGLVHYIPIEQMRDKYLVGVCNLKPANMRGVKSFAMVLCATSKEGKEGGIELIQPPPNSKPGERVYFEGPDFENATPLSQLNPKKKIFETVQPGFITLESKEAAWVNPVTKSVHRIRTKDSICIAPTLVGASLS
ncbi:nucleic acid-binding protein [Daedalea quercina L-15889]|uniref:Nucleic acid-binding protein n=1 Tax=Daedalea quercina L-15889 TaxID=1314783 RepID=A0A165TQY5_9APHY|nr:nucleic acid-binding protein [Daedalea quercina L-15889]